MFNPLHYTERPVINKTSKINVSAVIRALLLELKVKYGESGISQIRINSREEADNIKKLVNEEYHKFEALIVPQHDSSLTVDYISSNLKCGFIFYFVCNRCGRRTRHLYQVSSNGQLSCRICHRLKYTKTPNKDQRIRRLLKNPQQLVNYLSSTPKHYEIANEALEAIKQLRGM